MTFQWSINRIKVHWCWFQQCCSRLTTLLVEGSSKTVLFRHSSDHVFRGRNIGSTKSMKVIFFFKIFNIYITFQKFTKKLRKSLCFWDNSIWIGIVKLCLLRREYFSSAGNVLTSSPKIWHVKKRDFFQLNWLGSDQWIW